MLTPVWTKTPEVERKQRIRAVLAWCQAHGFIEHNVAGEMIDGALAAEAVDGRVGRFCSS